MPLISTSLTLLVTGLLLGFVNVSIPMSQRSHRILNVGVFVSVILLHWVSQKLGSLYEKKRRGCNKIARFSEF